MYGPHAPPPLCDRHFGIERKKFCDECSTASLSLAAASATYDQRLTRHNNVVAVDNLLARSTEFSPLKRRCYL